MARSSWQIYDDKIPLRPIQILNYKHSASHISCVAEAET